MLVKLGRTITLAELAKMTEASLYNVINPEEIKFDYVTTDSREVKEGCLFVALKGENFDGNEYIEKAADKGAVCTLCSKLSENVKIPCAHCEDTLTALGIFAKKYKRELSLKTCAVTGSVGKTTTKEFIYAVMSNNFNTAKSEGNYNNEIGLPMTLLQLDEKIDCAVVEVGMNFMREVANLSEIAHPDYAVITNIGTSHIENLGSRENICKAKLEIAEGLSKDGILFYNGDEVLLREGVKNLSLKCVAVGFEEGAQIRAIDICEKEDCIEFDIYSFGENRGRFKINVLGKHNVYNALFAYAVGRELCMDDDSIRNGLIGFKNTGMRQRIYSVNGVKIIEDCYNASPESMKASLGVLASLKERGEKRCIAVLGNMLELGEFSENLHREVGKAASSDGVDILYTFGKDALEIGNGARNSGMNKESIYSFEDIDSVDILVDSLVKTVRAGDAVLFKASRGVKLERVIREFENKLGAV